MNLNELSDKVIMLAEQKIKEGSGPFSAVIFDDNNNVVSEGWNQVTELNDPTAHAEIQAIRKACQSLNTFSLKGYSIMASCRPCSMCLSAIYWARIEKVYYIAESFDAEKAGFDDSAIHKEICIPDTLKNIIIQKINNRNATKPFQAWTKLASKKNY